MLYGARCSACGHALALRVARCTRCRAAALEAARFGPDGTVWSTTTLHVAGGGRTAPYTLAYVDLDDGPRVLAHVAGGRVAVGARVRLAGTDAARRPARGDGMNAWIYGVGHDALRPPRRPPARRARLGGGRGGAAPTPASTPARDRRRVRRHRVRDARGRAARAVAASG